MALPSGFRFTRRWWVPLTAVFAGLFAHFVLYGWLLTGLTGALGLLWIFAAKLGHVPFDD